MAIRKVGKTTVRKASKSVAKTVKKAAGKSVKKVVAKTARKTAASAVAGKASARKTVAKKAVVKKAAKIATTKAAKQASARKAAKKGVKKMAARQTPAKKTPAPKVATRATCKTPADAPAPIRRKRTARASKPRITPEQALVNTQELLAAKRERDHQPQPWQQFDLAHGQIPKSGFQSGSAAAKAGSLHAAESRMEAIQGSIGSQDRTNQGKRDAR